MCSQKYLKCLAVGTVCCHVVISTHTRLKTDFTGLLTLFGLHDLMSFSCLLHISTDSPWWVCSFVTVFHFVSCDVTSGFPSFPFYFYFLTFASMFMSSVTSPFLLCFLYCFLFMALANSLFDSSILFLCIYTLHPPLTSCPPCFYIYCVLHVQLIRLSTLMIEGVRSSENFVHTYQTTWVHMPEKSDLYWSS